MHTLGIDIGGTKMAARILNGDTLTTLAEHTIPTPAAAKPQVLTGAVDTDSALRAGRAALLDSIVALCDAIDIHIHNVQRIGIGTAGQVDTDTGTILDASDNLIGWNGTPLAALLSERVGLPVFVDNDVRVMALAELKLGAAKPYQHVLCITVGTGIGGAIVINGKLWRGANFSAGEIGYIFGGMHDSRPHTIEQLYGGAAIERIAFGGASTLRELLARGDADAQRVVQDAAHALGVRLAPVFAFVDPQAVIIGGGVAEIGPLWWDAFAAGVRSFELVSVQQMPLLPAALGSAAGAIGAALLALER